MPAKELDIKTIAAATAGLCLAAGAAAFSTSSPSHDGDALTLAPAPVELIVIEDDFEVSVASADVQGIDPMAWASEHGIVIEDDDEPVLASAADAIEIMDDGDGSEERGSSMFAALAGSVGSIAVSVDAPKPMAVAPSFDAPKPRMDLARPSMASAPASDDREEQLAVLDTSSSRSSATSGRSGAATGARKATLQRSEGLSSDQIASAIRMQLPKVRACYERELKSDADLRGRMVLSMNVQASGNVSRARVKGDELGNDELSACVVRELAKFRFPAGVETVAVEYPVNFKPQF